MTREKFLHDAKKISRRFVGLLLQVIARVATQFIYRIKIEGTIDVPKGKGVLIIANHTSFIDFLVLAHIVSFRRIVHSVMDYEIFSKPIINILCRIAYTIPITSKAVSIEVREQAFIKIKELLSKGEYVLFFPEGIVTYDGNLGEFRYGFDRIRNENPDSYIVPVSISGLIGGFFSRVGGLFNQEKLDSEKGRPVTIKIAPAVPASRWSLTNFETKIRLMLNHQHSCPTKQEMSLPALRITSRQSILETARGEIMPAKSQANHRIILLDLSKNGLCVLVSHEMAVGQHLKIYLDDLKIDFIAEVRWCKKTDNDSFRIGVKSLQEIDLYKIFTAQPSSIEQGQSA